MLFGRPLKSSLAAATVIAPILTGRLAWVAEGTGSSRVALRLSNVRRVGGARIATSRLVVMRASKALVRRLANVAPGTGVTLRTAAATPTLERQMLRNGAWVLSAS